MTDAPRLARPALFAALVANAVGQSFLFVVLPGLGRRLGFSDIQTGALLSVSALLLIVSAPAWGFLSERIGRRPVLLLGLMAASLAPLGFAFVTASRLSDTLSVSGALALLFLLRLGQAAIAGGIMPAAQALIADSTGSARRAQGMGLLGAAYGIGAILGAGLAWRLGGAEPTLAFGIVAGACGLGFLAVLLLVPEARRAGAPQQGGSGLALAELWPHLAITLLAITAYAMLQQVMSLRLQDGLRMSPEEAIGKAGAALMVTSIAMIAVQGIGLRFLKLPPLRLLLLGAAIAVPALCLLALAPAYLVMLAALVAFGAALGLMLSGNLAALSLAAGRGAQGKVAGLNALRQGAGMALGPILGAALHQLSPVAPFWAVVVLLTAILALCLRPARAAAVPEPTR
ncbi:MFS transporter [Bosea vestrisii]|uniref:MFS transporter n=1 Tax=Bosea vestrisii TaxID=151416 RepID=A0ABW0HAX8_9HYPH